MSVQTYEKRPVKVVASQLTEENLQELADWCNGTRAVARAHGEVVPCLLISTLEGTMRADLSDWIVQGIKGEFYPCKPDVFDASYRLVE